MSMPRATLTLFGLTFAFTLALTACPNETGTNANNNGREGEGDEGEGEAGEGEGEGNEGEGEGTEGEGEGEGEGEITCDSTEGLTLYQTKIEPLVSGSVPTTCNQCHLEGVDLSLYVQDTPCETMACFISQGEVTLADPLASPVLARILNSDPASNLIDDSVIQNEHDGFLEWINWNAECFDGTCGVIDDPCNSGTGQQAPPDLSPLGGCDEDTLVASFNTKVFAWRGRCQSCHATYGLNLDPDLGLAAPDWIFGAQESPVGPDDARFTMFSVIGRQLIDRANPTNSLLLTKPLNIDGGHGGGTKIQDTSEQTYVDFLSWINEYAACRPPSAEGEGEGEGGGEGEGEGDPGPQDPVARINHPGANDGPRPSGVEIPFIGLADDPQEGSLTGASLVWTSDLLAQPFGTGTQFNAVLPDGTNTVVLTATDSDGNTGRATIVVVVQ